MEISFQQVSGAIGEYYAAKTLIENGYSVCRADSINFLGHSLLNDASLKEFDCSELEKLSSLCRRFYKCQVDNYPCKNSVSEFFQFNRDPVPYFRFPSTGDNKFRFYCAINMTYIVTLDKCGLICEKSSCPIRSYLKINGYIHNFYDYYPRKFKHDDPVQHKEWSNLWAGHPGRIDFFAHRNGQSFLIEVKVNKSEPSKWQIVRLDWMKKEGFGSYIFRVKFAVKDKEQLRQLFTEGKNDVALELLQPSYEMVEFDLNEFIKAKVIIPSREDVLRYNKMGFHWIADQFIFTEELRL